VDLDKSKEVAAEMRCCSCIEIVAGARHCPVGVGVEEGEGEVGVGAEDSVPYVACSKTTPDKIRTTNTLAVETFFDVQLI
jgi:hypothetical protein